MKLAAWKFRDTVQPGLVRWILSLKGDGLFQRLVRNSSKLLAGNLVQSVCGLITLGLSARALQPVDFGQLVLANSYAAIVGQLLAFQAWQAVIRYGAAAHSNNDLETFGTLVRFGFRLDLVAASAAAVVACIGVAMGGLVLHLSPQQSAIGYLFAAALVFSINGTPTAILRICDNYRAFIVSSTLSSIVKLSVVVTAYALQVGLWGFALCWAATQVFQNCVLVLLARQQLRKNGITPLRRFPLSGVLRRFDGIIGFFISTNLNASARVLREADTPVVGLLLGPGAAGSFKLGRQIATAMNRLVDPFFHAIYPDLARMYSNGEIAAALQLVKRSSFTLGLVGLPALLLFILIGQPLLVLVLGEAYASTYAVAVWCVAGAVVWAFCHPMSPMLMAAGLHRPLLFVNVVCTVLYLIALALAAYFLQSAAMAAAMFFAYLLLWLYMTSRLLRSVSRER